MRKEDRKKAQRAKKARKTWPTGSCPSRSAGFGATIKFGTRQKEAARTCPRFFKDVKKIFQRTERRAEEVEEDATAEMDDDWSGKPNFSVRSTAIGVRDGSRGGSRGRCALAGGPLADSLGVSLCRWGSGRAAGISFV